MNDSFKTLDTNLGFDQHDFTALVVRMINLVSCCGEDNKTVEEPWMLIPRYSDRLEAIGQPGIDRCLEYNIKLGAPLYTDTTPRVYNQSELEMIATPDRYQTYKRLGKSESMIDHYYDKLLHVGKPEHFQTTNSYLVKERDDRVGLMSKYVLDYWHHIKYSDLKK